MYRLVFILLLLPNLLLAQGIHFKSYDINTALENAKKQNLDVFLYVHTSFCENCNWMSEQVFESKKVGHYYNDKYISLSIDASSKEGKALVEKYQLEIYPSFLYIDSKNKPLHLLVGNMNADDFIKNSKEATDPKQQLFTLENKITESSSIEELSEYIYVTYKAAREDSVMLRAFLDKIEHDHIEIKSIWFALREATTHMGLHSDALLYVVKHAKEIENQYGIKEIIQTINAAAKVSMRPFVMNRDAAGWQDLMTYLEKELGKQGQTLNYAYNPSFYLNIKDYSTAFNKMEQGVNTLKDRDPEIKAYLYRNWAWNIYNYYNDNDKISEGLNWINQAIQVHPTCMNLETKAGLLFKQKNYKEAKLIAEQAIELEKKEKVHAMLAHTILDELENIE